MVKVQEVYDYLCSIAPLELQCSFDNAGFQIGRSDKTVNKVLLALDVTNPVIDEAVDKGADLILSHHPILFTPVKRITDAEYETEKLLRLAEKGIAVISMHTNLDIVSGGVNDVLIAALGASSDAALDEEGCGRIGRLDKPVSMKSFLSRCKTVLNAKGLRYYDAGREVDRIAVMGGAGGECVARAFQLGCDTYVTADIKYHQFLLASELGINLIDADHFCTENPIIPELSGKLRAAFPELSFEISERHHPIVDFL